MLTQVQVVELTGISETTIHYLEHGLRKPQTGTLQKLLNLYAIRIKRVEKLDQIWGEDGLSSMPTNSVPQAKNIAQKYAQRSSNV